MLRKAIKLTLLAPDNQEYRDFADGALQIFYDGRALQLNQELSDVQRHNAIVELDDRVLALCSVREIEPTKLDDPIADSFRLLRSELLGLMMDEQLFTFVSNPVVAPTNNEAERSLREANAEASEKSKLDLIYPHYKEAQDKKQARKRTKQSAARILIPATG